MTVRMCSTLLTVLFIAIQSSFAQKPTDNVGNYTVTSIGNSLPEGAGGGRDWRDYRSHMMNNCFGIEVAPDGRVYAGGGNESGHAISVYRDGTLESDHIPKCSSDRNNCWNWGTSNKGAVSFDKDYMYSISSCGNVNKWTRTPPYERVHDTYKTDVAADEIVVRFDRMYVVDSKTEEIQIRSLDATWSVINAFTVAHAYDIAVENEHSLWVSLGDSVNEVVHYDDAGNKLPGTLSGFGKLQGISISFQGELLVCDDGPRKQVLFYDLSDSTHPILIRQFGEQGGIYNGNRGVLDNDLQFFDIQDADTDSAGNIYTLFSTPNTIGQSGGNMVRAYSPDGVKLWELSNELWTGCASVLPSSDGLEIYGVEEVFRFDPDAAAGPLDQQWKLYAISKDDITCPSDFREINSFPSRPFRGSAEMRERDGKRIMFRQGMYAETITGESGYDLLMFEDSPSMISHRCGQITTDGWKCWAWYPDADGNVWAGNDHRKIRMYTFSGFTADGCPRYDGYDEYDTPPFFSYISKIYYDTDNDALYLSGYTPESDTGLPRGIAGTHLARYDGWKAGTPQKQYDIELPWDNNHRNLPPKTMYVAGDYVFCVAVRPSPDGISQKVTVFSAESGEKMGTMSASDQYGALGWVDIARGLTAFKRTSGEYLVIVEENAYAKNMVYRWCPGGDCRETTDLRSLSIKARARTQADVYLQIAGERLILDFTCGTTTGIVHITDCCGRTVFRKTLRNADRMVVPIDDKARKLYFAKVFTRVTSTVHRFMLR